MELEFKVHDQDFLTYQLYNATRSESIKKVRKRNRSLISILYLVVCVLFLLMQNYAMAFGFFLISLLWFIVYPKVERKSYIKKFKKHIAEHLKDRSNIHSKVVLKDDVWHSYAGANETQFPFKEIKEINEIDAYYFIKLKSGHSLIIPKREIKQVGELTRLLQEAALKYKFNYFINLKWEWR